MRGPLKTGKACTYLLYVQNMVLNRENIVILITKIQDYMTIKNYYYNILKRVV